MLVTELIRKKQSGKTLTSAEICWLVDNYTTNNIPDYQMAAWLQAVMFKSLNLLETIALTRAMVNSGKFVERPKSGLEWIVDKHSTGGLGDKVTLLLLPLLQALGFGIMKLSGKGLGITGGTLDKLASIPGIKLSFTESELQNHFVEYGCVLGGASRLIAPADQKIYQLRDATASVANLPLIAASIMAKKLVLPSDLILVDIKCGSGAFAKDLNAAIELGKLLEAISKDFNRKLQWEVTNMNVPLGETAGNAIELQEVCAILKGKFTNKVWDVAVASALRISNYLLGRDILKTSKIITSLRQNGTLYAYFQNWIKSQGGDTDWGENCEKLWHPAYKVVIQAAKKGYLSIPNCSAFGQINLLLGANRKTKDATVDYQAGLRFLVSPGQLVYEKQAICELYSSSPITSAVQNQTLGSFEYLEQPQKEMPLFLKTSFGKEMTHGTTNI